MFSIQLEFPTSNLILYTEPGICFKLTELLAQQVCTTILNNLCLLCLEKHFSTSLWKSSMKTKNIFLQKCKCVVFQEKECHLG